MFCWLQQQYYFCAETIGGDSQDIHKLKTTPLCFRCGKTGHAPDKCRFKEATCHHCGKLGHIKPICRSKKAEKPPDRDDQLAKKRVHHVQDKDNAEDSQHTTVVQDAEEYEELFNVSSGSRLQPYTTTLLVEGQQLAMEIDTGASVSQYQMTLASCYGLTNGCSLVW